MPANVLLLRGHHPTVWGLRAFERLPERFAVRLAVTGRPHYSLDGLALEQVPVRTIRDRIPGATVGAVVTLALPDRVLHAEHAYAGADIVHAEELSLWFTAQAARLKARARYKLVVTVWETLPQLQAYRTPHARRFRNATLAAADLFLAATRRARHALLLEGVPEEKILLAYPGVDVERFAQPPARGGGGGGGGGSSSSSSDHNDDCDRDGDGDGDGHLVISPGRLEWEKGHHDVLRAVAALKRGIVAAPADAVRGLRLHLIGSGPEESRLREHAAELGIGEIVTIGALPYEQMPALYGRASALLLGSLPRSGCTLHPGDIPRCFWEEQFGLVLAEAMAAGLPMVLSTSGAIPEVAGERAMYAAPGDWIAMARALADGPLSRPPGERVEYPAEVVQRYSTAASAERIAAAYDRVLSDG
jgi:glycosyltransferase involved in cell wall biosynthesis